MPQVLKLREAEAEKIKLSNETVWSFECIHFPNFINNMKKINSNCEILNQCMLKPSSKVDPHLPQIQIDPLPKWVIATIETILREHNEQKIHNEKKMLKNEQDNKEIKNEDHYIQKIGKKLWSELYPHQRQGLEFSVAKNGRVMLCDMPGLGKTLGSLAVAKYFSEAWPLLIISMPKVKPVWLIELELFLQISDDQVQMINSKVDLNGGVPLTPLEMKEREASIGDGSYTGPTVTIISFNLADPLAAVLASYNFKFIIVDESSLVKNYDAKRSMAISTLTKNAKHAMFLSGTFAVISAQAYTSVHSICPKYFSYFEPFGQRYCDPQQKEIKRDGKVKIITEYKGCENRNELHIVLSKLFMLRRTLAQAGIVLPPLNRHHVTLNPNKKDMKLVKKHMEKVDSKEIKLVEEDEAFGKDNAFMSAWRKIGKLKIPCCQAYLRNLLRDKKKKDQKILVFGHHKVMLDAMQEVLEEEEVGFVRMDGKTANKNTKGIVVTFQKNLKCRVAVLSISAAGIGITLTAATIVLFTELHPNSEYLLQSEARAHRMGQKLPVDVYYLMFPNSIDEVIFQMTRRKVENLTGLCDGFAKTFGAKRIIDVDENEKDQKDKKNKKKKPQNQSKKKKKRESSEDESDSESESENDDELCKESKNVKKQNGVKDESGSDESSEDEDQHPRNLKPQTKSNDDSDSEESSEDEHPKNLKLQSKSLQTKSNDESGSDESSEDEDQHPRNLKSPSKVKDDSDSEESSEDEDEQPRNLKPLDKSTNNNGKSSKDKNNKSKNLDEAGESSEDEE